MPLPRRVVCFGSSRCAPDSRAASEAESVGRLLAERGIAVVSGGYGGTMEAVSRGAGRAGGAVVGITTPIFRSRQANGFVGEEIVEPDYPARLARLLREGDGFVAMPGALGTASEWITAWCLATIDQLGGPLYVYSDPWGPLVDALLALPESAPGHADLLVRIEDSRDLARHLDAL